MGSSQKDDPFQDLLEEFGEDLFMKQVHGGWVFVGLIDTAANYHSFNRIEDRGNSAEAAFLTDRSPAEKVLMSMAPTLLAFALSKRLAPSDQADMMAAMLAKAIVQPIVHEIFYRLKADEYIADALPDRFVAEEYR